MPVRNTEFANIEFYPNDTQEIVLERMKELRKAKLQEEMAELNADKIKSYQQYARDMKKLLYSYQNAEEESGIQLEQSNIIDKDADYATAFAEIAHNFASEKFGKGPAKMVKSVIINNSPDINNMIQQFLNTQMQNLLTSKLGDSEKAKELFKELNK